MNRTITAEVVAQARESPTVVESYVLSYDSREEEFVVRDSDMAEVGRISGREGHEHIARELDTLVGHE